MDKLHEFKEFIEDELEKIRKKGDLTPAELESSYKAVDILKDIEEIKEKKEGRTMDEDGYSGGRWYRMPYYGSSYDMWRPDQNDHMPQYSGAYDYMPRYSSRRRDRMGRYSRDGRYSGNYNRYSNDGYYRIDGMYSHDDAKDMVMEHLRTAMDSADNDHERDTIRRCMEEL